MGSSGISAEIPRAASYKNMGFGSQCAVTTAVMLMAKVSDRPVSGRANSLGAIGFAHEVWCPAKDAVSAQIVLAVAMHELHVAAIATWKVCALRCTAAVCAIVVSIFLPS